MLAFDTPPPPPPQEPAVVLVHDARAVHDTASLKFGEFTPEGRPAWVLAVVTPGPRSGSAIIPGAFINADTGQLVTPPNAQAVMMKEGSWKALATAEQTGQHTEGRYSWSEPIDEEKRKLLPEDYYSPFAYGGTILFRQTRAAGGIEQFGTVRLLFPDWGHYVTPAFSFTKTHPGLTEDGNVGMAELPRLTQLLSQENKLLAVQAFRELLASRQMAPAAAGEHVVRAEANLSAVYIYLLLASPGGGRQPLVEEVNSAVRVSPDVAKLRSAALGAFAASLFCREDAGVVSRSKSILGAVRQRLKALGVAVEKDAYLSSLFERMGLYTND